MADLDRSRRRVELNNQRLHWISVLVDLAVFYLFGLAFTLLYPHIATFFPSSGFDLSKLYSLAYDERFYQLFIGPCRLHKDGGLPHAGCIRLIHFRPDPDSSPDSAGHLVVENRVFPITSAPTYRALSYTWGEAFGKPGEHSFTPRSALYGGQPIPSNLASAFDRLARLNLEEDEWSAWYWVDFVSIDQENIRERGEQVGNMHRIYQQAEAVDIWLGPADDSEASQVTEVLRYIVHHADSPGNRCRPRFPNHLIPDREWDILASFFSRRWFHRLWTLQEFALASQVRIMLGDEYIDPALLWRAATFLYNRAIPLPLHYGHNHSAGYAIVQFSILRKCVEDTDQLLRLLPMFATRENRRPDYETVLAWLFWRSAATFATDARDYIYGILGIADTIMEDLAQATECNSNVSRCAPAYTPIKPDYSLDTARVFRDFIIRLMYGSVGIRAMTLIQGRGEIGAFESGRELQRHAQPTWIDHEGKSPSWIPNLAHKNMFPLSSGGGPSFIQVIFHTAFPYPRY
ncbi:hypothetical protein CkaCkLH20_10130 [Colletotrichum karsti]|uniref:Heterokaryon incompatibility domain-containing protein n=1 Tax=Colletotrichum karsti TaxID=1095194 RepID=A0A9P6HVR0_9PEZI|nr:uncharacterized protein CkaCkLH20_10130 [Colletotrichum karsti]KAF9872303.1 hypothetical protein CkaCkLH20_10130 [Colletotrichum karsti]